MLHAGMVLNGRYEIIKVIGKGGMSTVYQARDLNLGILLAIKDVDRSGGDSNQVVEQSLAAEGRMLMQLRNPHLPRIYDIIENPENFMLVMDYIEGESLDKVIKREGAQPMDRVLDWGMQICEVFTYLHNQPRPIIYRDMKPANVMLQPDGHLMMIDFGTARTEKVGVSMQADTICIGTAGFAAPEQFGGIGQSTAKTDIFCLGATLYNMITGHSPCDRPQGILPLERWNPALANTPISQIIYKCTRNDPDERYQTAAELYEDLRLARTGNFGSNRGKSGSLLKPSWQKQELKSTSAKTGALSGLIQRGRTAAFGAPAAQNAAPAQQPAAQQAAAPKPNNGWQSAQSTPAATRSNVAYAQQPVQQPAQQSWQQSAATQQPQQQGNALWRKLMVVGIAAAVIFVVFTVLLALLNQIIAAGLFLVIALGGAGLALLSALNAKRT